HVMLKEMQVLVLKLFGVGNALGRQVQAGYVKPFLVKVNSEAAFAAGQVHETVMRFGLQMVQERVHEPLRLLHVTVFVKYVIVRRVKPGTEPICWLCHAVRVRGELLLSGGRTSENSKVI